jgi:membrane fusion protein, multidrug efflux system
MTIYRWLIAIAIITTSLTGLFGYKYLLISEHAQQDMNEQAATVEAIQVVQTSYQKTIVINGVVKAIRTMQVSNELTGKITKLNFSSGELVDKGQVLLEIDHSEESAQLVAARANLTLHKKTLDRYRTLHAKDEISEEAVDTAIAALHTSESEIAVLRSIINKKIIRAPFKAKAGIHDLQVGQYLERNSQLTHIIGVSKYFWIDFHVPQIYKQLSISSMVYISLGGSERRSTNAKIVSIEPMLSNESRHLKYRAQIVNDKLALKHNHLVKVTLPVTDESLKIAIPNLAVSKTQLGDYVFILKADKEGVYRANRQKVELGDHIGDLVIVNHGLVVGDYIASKGAFKLRPGLKVFVSSPETNGVELIL